MEDRLETDSAPPTYSPPHMLQQFIQSSFTYSTTLHTIQKIQLEKAQLPLKMVDEIDFENGRISSFQRHVTLTLDRAIWHTVTHHSSTSTHTQNFIGIGNFLWMDGRTDMQTDGQTLTPT